MKALNFARDNQQKCITLNRDKKETLHVKTKEKEKKASKRKTHCKMDAQRQTGQANHLREEANGIQSANDLAQYKRNMH